MVRVMLLCQVRCLLAGDGYLSCDEFVSYYLKELPSDPSLFSDTIRDFQEVAEYVRSKLLKAKTRSPSQSARSPTKSSARANGDESTSSPTKSNTGSASTNPWNVPEEPKRFNTSASPGRNSPLK